MKRTVSLFFVVIFAFVLSEWTPLAAQDPGDPVVAGDEAKTKKKKYPDIDVGGEIEIEYVDTQVERESPGVEGGR